MVIAILFFGLTRSLTTTIHSMRTNLLSPLTDACIDYDIFVHTNKIVGEYHNRWSNEHTDDYINADVETLLQPKYYIWDNQADININFDKYYTHLGNWPKGVHDKELTKYLIRNMCLALYSKKQITLLFEHKKDDYDYAIIVRPDLQFNTKLNVEWLNELNDTNIIIPSMQWFAGCNDRFCIGRHNVIIYYGKLFDELKIYIETTSIISEKFFMDKLNEKSINIISKEINYDNLRIMSQHVTPLGRQRRQVAGRPSK